MRARHNLPQHQILRDPLAYIEYIAKYDRENTINAFKDGGKDTILRACIAPGEGMPLRALGFLAMLEHINRVYLPKAEAQLVIAVNTAERVNGPLQQGSRAATAALFAEYAMCLPPHPNTKKMPLIVHDNPDLPYVDHGQIREALQGTPEGKKLQSQADRRSSDYVSYLAAHVAIHDTSDSVHAIDDGSQPMRNAKRIISVGGKFEETFYKARMRLKALGIQPSNTVAETGQLITRHATAPPYEFGRQLHHHELFDPPITDPLAIRDEILASPFHVRSSGILRDLVHIRDYVDEASRVRSEMAITYTHKEFLEDIFVNLPSHQHVI